MEKYFTHIYHHLRPTPTGIIEEKAYTFTTQLILNTAAELNIKITPIPNSHLIQLEKDGQIRYLSRQTPINFNSYLSHKATNNKAATKYFLNQAGINTAKEFLIRRADDTQLHQQVYQTLQKPLVIKPVDGCHGEDVFVGLSDWLTFQGKLQQVLAQSPKALVEEMYFGTEYRLTATKRKLLAVTNRVPANIIGDGQQTIKELIKNKNKGRAHTMLEGPLVKIKVDEETRTLLEEQNLTLESIPTKGQLVPLKKVSNISAGGDSIDFTDQAHPSVTQLAQQVIRAIPGLKFAGIDLLCEDITRDINDQKYCIIELNDSPGFSIAQLPAQGRGRPIAQEFLQLLFAD